MKKELDFTGLPEALVKKLSGYIEALITKIGKGLRSIVVYGSAASGEFDPKRSNVNLIVVVEKLDLDMLHQVQPHVKKGSRKGIVAPLFLTTEHMKTSSDVFPIEFLDMSDFHVVVWGDDPFKRLAIGTENLRLECEEKLKGSLINLRQSYLEVADHRSAMMNLVSSSITGLCSIFRGLIRLQGEKAPSSKKDVITRMAELYQARPDNFLSALEIKLSAPRMTRDEMDSFFATYLDDIEKLALQVDKMGKKKVSTRKPASKKAVPKKITGKKKPTSKVTAKSSTKRSSSKKTTKAKVSRTKPAVKKTTKKSTKAPARKKK